jgi:hypothetical protein
MLLSEMRGWHYGISWDNPCPADSSTMLKSLRKLGKVTRLQTKTSVILFPRVGVTYWDVRRAIVENLHPAKGNAFYVNLRSRETRQYGKRTDGKWKRIV